MKRQLNLGCGFSKARRIAYDPAAPDGKKIRGLKDGDPMWEDVTHVDELEAVPADYHFDVYHPGSWPGACYDGLARLMKLDWEGEFDEVHLYEVVEHLGRQGDWKDWIAFWHIIWRVLKPGGKAFITTPLFPHKSAVEDPGHTRFLAQGSFWWLDPCILELNKKQGTTMAQYPLPEGMHLHNEYVVGFHVGKELEPSHLYAVLEARK